MVETQNVGALRERQAPGESSANGHSFEGRGGLSLGEQEVRGGRERTGWVCRSLGKGASGTLGLAASASAPVRASGWRESYGPWELGGRCLVTTAS